MKDQQDDTYTPLGVTLTGSTSQDYGPDLAVAISLYRCGRCGAVVAVDDGWGTDGRDIHTDWHGRDILKVWQQEEGQL